MLNNYVVRCTVQAEVFQNPVVRYMRYQGYPFVKFTESLMDCTFFGGKGITYAAADLENVVRHTALLFDKDSACYPSFKSIVFDLVKDFEDFNGDISIKLDVVRFTGEDLESLKISVSKSFTTKFQRK